MKTELTQAQKEARGRLAMAKTIVTDAGDEALDLGLPGTAGLFRRIETRLVGNTIDKIDGAIRWAITAVDARRTRMAVVQDDPDIPVARRAGATCARSVLADAKRRLDTLVAGRPNVVAGSPDEDDTSPEQTDE